MPKVAIIHISPKFEPEIYREVKELVEKLGASINITHEGQELTL